MVVLSPFNHQVVSCRGQPDEHCTGSFQIWCESLLRCWSSYSLRTSSAGSQYIHRRDKGACPLVNRVTRNSCSSKLVEENSCRLFCVVYLFVLLSSNVTMASSMNYSNWLSCAPSAILQFFGRSALTHFLIRLYQIWFFEFGQICDVKSGRSRGQIWDFFMK